jgi:hypothetical protein
MEQAVTITFVPEQVVTWLIIGLLAGFLASVVVRGKGMTTLGSLLVQLGRDKRSVISGADDLCKST